MLKRNWNKDKERIQETFKHINQHKVPIWLITHPEGTRFSEEKMEKSHQWAKKNDLPLFDHVLLPRSQGLIATIQGIGEVIDAVYDITIGFDGNRILDLADAVLPQTGRHVHLHIRRFPIESVPKDPIEIDKWLLSVWEEKEKLMEEFKKNGKFPNQYNLPYANEGLNI
jgi:1-acyl-sn-glycerol-3-phosphate acyltransferase